MNPMLAYDRFLFDQISIRFIRNEKKRNRPTAYFQILTYRLAIS